MLSCICAIMTTLKQKNIFKILSNRNLTPSRLRTVKNRISRFHCDSSLKDREVSTLKRDNITSCAMAANFTDYYSSRTVHPNLTDASRV